MLLISLKLAILLILPTQILAFSCGTHHSHNKVSCTKPSTVGSYPLSVISKEYSTTKLYASRVTSIYSVAKQSILVSNNAFLSTLQQNAKHIIKFLLFSSLTRKAVIFAHAIVIASLVKVCLSPDFHNIISKVILRIKGAGVFSPDFHNIISQVILRIKGAGIFLNDKMKSNKAEIFSNITSFKDERTKLTAIEKELNLKTQALIFAKAKEEKRAILEDLKQNELMRVTTLNEILTEEAAGREQRDQKMINDRRMLSLAWTQDPVDFPVTSRSEYIYLYINAYTYINVNIFTNRLISTIIGEAVGGRRVNIFCIFYHYFLRT
jgi:hypothetical protein